MYITRINTHAEMNRVVEEFRKASHGDPPIRVFGTASGKITDAAIKKDAEKKFAGTVFKTIDEIVYCVENGELEMVMVGTLMPLSQTWAETMSAGIFAPIEQLFAIGDGAKPGRALN